MGAAEGHWVADEGRRSTGRNPIATRLMVGETGAEFESRCSGSSKCHKMTSCQTRPRSDECA
jgi:hypothetical protein